MDIIGRGGFGVVVDKDIPFMENIITFNKTSFKKCTKIFLSKSHFDKELTGIMLYKVQDLIIDAGTIDYHSVKEYLHLLSNESKIYWGIHMIKFDVSLSDYLPYLIKNPCNLYTLLLSILEELSHMDEMGLIHCDIKMSNILINRDTNKACICDFSRMIKMENILDDLMLFKKANNFEMFPPEIGFVHFICNNLSEIQKILNYEYKNNTSDFSKTATIIRNRLCDIIKPNKIDIYMFGVILNNIIAYTEYSFLSILKDMCCDPEPSTRCTAKEAYQWLIKNISNKPLMLGKVE